MEGERRSSACRNAGGKTAQPAACRKGTGRSTSQDENGTRRGSNKALKAPGLGHRRLSVVREEKKGTKGKKTPSSFLLVETRGENTQGGGGGGGLTMIPRRADGLIEHRGDRKPRRGRRVTLFVGQPRARGGKKRVRSVHSGRPPPRAPRRTQGKPKTRREGTVFLVAQELYNTQRGAEGRFRVRGL